MKESTSAKVYSVIGFILMIIGFLIGAILGSEQGTSSINNAFNGAIFIAYTLSGLLSGLIFIGIGIIISKIDDFNNEMNSRFEKLQKHDISDKVEEEKDSPKKEEPVNVKS